MIDKSSPQVGTPGWCSDSAAIQAVPNRHQVLALLHDPHPSRSRSTIFGFLCLHADPREMHSGPVYTLPHQSGLPSICPAPLPTFLPFFPESRDTTSDAADRGLRLCRGGSFSFAFINLAQICPDCFYPAICLPFSNSPSGYSPCTSDTQMHNQVHWGHAAKGRKSENMAAYIIRMQATDLSGFFGGLVSHCCEPSDLIVASLVLADLP